MQEKSRKRLRRLRKNDMVHKTMEKHVKAHPVRLIGVFANAARKTRIQGSSPP